MDAAGLPPSDRSRVRRIPSRGRYDRALIDAIIDEALICHVGIVEEGQPFVIPTIHGRIGDELFLHGSRGSRLLRVIGAGSPACISVTLVDGLVLARSAFHHSMNYRSVVVLGRGRPVEEAAEKSRVFEALVEHVVPGRSSDARMPSESESAATAVVAFPIDEASAKLRDAPVGDEEADYALPIWAGVLPLGLAVGDPIADARLHPDVATPDYVVRYRRPRS
ncbi:MAG: pyridoxamine 5'-phosphate oxidase family protein [Planctomycetes bacterium]|nr:pyridoxamine 5'-phosphate oxidase family protein [Planctomycetota bacterium]